MICEESGECRVIIEKAWVGVAAWLGRIPPRGNVGTLPPLVASGGSPETSVHNSWIASFYQQRGRVGMTKKVSAQTLQYSFQLLQGGWIYGGLIRGLRQAAHPSAACDGWEGQKSAG